MIKETDVCILGGGPAGMVLALLLAKLGVNVLVLEQHRNFDREYRGEVLMPRFTQMMRQIGLFGELEKCHHLKLQGGEGYLKDKRVLEILFRDIAPEVPFALWMPQPILLNFLHQKAQTFPSYEILFDTGAKSLIEENGTVKGVLAKNQEGEMVEVRARVTVGADGRFSTLRKLGGFSVTDEDYRFDIVWFTVPRPDDYENEFRFFLGNDYNCLILPKYPDLIQCGLIVAKGEYPKLVRAGVQNMRSILLKSHPLFRPFAESLKDFSEFSVLQAKIEYVNQWAKNGALLVGDSAHTCSPAGAIGVSMAVASAIVAADVIYDALQSGDVSARRLGKLQEIREEEVLQIQNAQKAFTRRLLNLSPIARYFLPGMLFFASRLGFFRSALRGFAVMNNPLPISNRLHF